jgi:hypothetical protein
MAHWLEYTPAPSDEPEDFEFDGTWEFTCDCPATAPCRWTSDCDCETWSLTIAKDGSWATHEHYNPAFDEDDEASEEEIAQQMTLIEGPRCNAYWWFHESDFRDWASPPREGKQEIKVEWSWSLEAYEFGYLTHPAAPVTAAG